MNTLGNLLMNRFDSEAREGFPNFRGAQVNGAFPISQQTVNELLTHISSRVTIRLESENRIRLQLLGLPTPLSGTLVGIDPSLTVTLRFEGLSRIALGLARPRLPSYAVLNGGELLVYAGMIPAVAAWRHLWGQLSAIGVATSPQFLYLSFTWKVD